MDAPAVSVDARGAAPLAWFAEAGSTRREAQVAGIGLRRAWAARHLPLGLQGATEVSVSRWWSGNSPDVGGASTQLAVMPVLRWTPARGAGWFLEAGVGLSVTDDPAGARSPLTRSRWNFEEAIALGWQPAPAWAVSLRYAHASNAGLRKPNPGEDRLALRWSVAF